MKIDTTLFLLLVGSSHGISFLRGDNNNIHNGRELMDDHSMFDRLMCNSAYSACESWSSQNYDLSSPVTIPCGTCVEMDATGTVALAGLNVEGKLVISSPVEIHTPYVLVQGDLDMSSDRPTNGTPDIKFVLTGDGVVSLAPHEDNTSRCEGGVCSFGKKPFAIAGGTLNVRGLPESCPTWTTLKNVQSSGPASGNAGPSYISPAPGCSDALVDTDFEDPMDSAWPDGWYRNYGGTDYTETDANGNNCRVYGGRTSSWNGPQLNWPAECVVPGPTYFISAKAMLRRPDGNPSNCASTGFNCLKITSFREDTGLGKSWNNRGTSGSHPDNEWFTFISTTVFDDIFDDADTALARRFFWEGPEAGVEIILDDIR